jgi:hypothetical protein
MLIWRYNRSRFISFVFSCKNYQEKLWTCFTKVEGFLTRNSKKIKFVFSNFSAIFYVFSKIQLKLNTI